MRNAEFVGRAVNCSHRGPATWRKSYKSLFGLIAGVACVSLAPAVSLAATINVPSGNQQLRYGITSNGNAIVLDSTTISDDLSVPIRRSNASSDFSASANVSAQGTPVVDVRAGTSSSSFDSVINARGALAYFVLINGPSSLLQVPVFFRSNLSVSAGGSSIVSSNEFSSASAALTIQNYDPNLNFIGTPFTRSIDAQNRIGSALSSGSLGIAETVTVDVGTYLAAIISAELQVQDGGFASAQADPYFFIDPEFAAAHPGYSLSFSQFAGNDPLGAVPEPATWILMMGGFGMVGAALRRRNKQQVGLRFAKV